MNCRLQGIVDTQASIECPEPTMSVNSEEVCSLTASVDIRVVKSSVRGGHSASVIISIYISTYQLVKYRNCNAGPESRGRYENNNNIYIYFHSGYHSMYTPLVLKDNHFLSRISSLHCRAIGPPTAKTMYPVVNLRMSISPTQVRIREDMHVEDTPPYQSYHILTAHAMMCHQSIC